MDAKKERRKERERKKNNKKRREEDKGERKEISGRCLRLRLNLCGSDVVETTYYTREGLVALFFLLLLLTCQVRQQDHQVREEQARLR